MWPHFSQPELRGSAPEAMGEPYEDAAGRLHARLLGQPIMIFAADVKTLLQAYRTSLELDLTRAVYVRAMFSTGHDSANRAAFRAEPPDQPELVGLALRGLKRQVDKATKGASLHA
jgi:hypothetical protein